MFSNAKEHSRKKPSAPFTANIWVLTGEGVPEQLSRYNEKSKKNTEWGCNLFQLKFILEAMFKN